MKYTILNTNNGSAMEMTFESKEQLDRWLSLNPDFKNVGKIEYSSSHKTR